MGSQCPKFDTELFWLLSCTASSSPRGCLITCELTQTPDIPEVAPHTTRYILQDKQLLLLWSCLPTVLFGSCLSVLLPIHFLHDTNNFKEHHHNLFSHFFPSYLLFHKSSFIPLNVFDAPLCSLRAFTTSFLRWGEKNLLLTLFRRAEQHGFIVAWQCFLFLLLIIPNMPSPFLATSGHRAYDYLCYMIISWVKSQF